MGLPRVKRMNSLPALIFSCYFFLQISAQAVIEKTIGACSLYVESGKTCIETPNYPNTYPADVNCQFQAIINASTLEVVSFDIERNYDFLTFSADERYSGSALDNPELDQRTITIGETFSFTSDGVVHDSGFKLCFAPRVYSEVSSLIAAEGDCTFDPDSNCIQTPNYPNAYGNNKRCTFTAINRNSVMSVGAFQLEVDYDFLIFGSSRYSGTSTLELEGRKISIGESFSFTSDSSESFIGFRLCFTIDPSATTASLAETTTSSPTTTTSSSTITTFFSTTTTTSSATTTTSSPTTTSESSLVVMLSGDCLVLDSHCIQTPNYPENYGNSKECTFEIVNTYSVLEVLAFNLEDDYDFLTFSFDEKYSGSAPGLNGRQMTIGETFTFTSDTTEHRSGFHLCFEANPSFTPSPTVGYECEVCTNDDTKLDSNGYTCDSRAEHFPSECGFYDTPSFIASTHCCACGGGNKTQCNRSQPHFARLSLYAFENCELTSCELTCESNVYIRYQSQSDYFLFDRVPNSNSCDCNVTRHQSYGDPFLNSTMSFDPSESNFQCSGYNNGTVVCDYKPIAEYYANCQIHYRVNAGALMGIDSFKTVSQDDQTFVNESLPEDDDGGSSIPITTILIGVGVALALTVVIGFFIARKMRQNKAKSNHFAATNFDMSSINDVDSSDSEDERVASNRYNQPVTSPNYNPHTFAVVSPVSTPSSTFGDHSMRPTSNHGFTTASRPTYNSNNYSYNPTTNYNSPTCDSNFGSSRDISSMLDPSSTSALFSPTESPSESQRRTEEEAASNALKEAARVAAEEADRQQQQQRQQQERKKSAATQAEIIRQQQIEEQERQEAAAQQIEIENLNSYLFSIE